MKIKIIVVFWLTLLHFSLSLKYSRPFPSRSTTNNKPAWSSRPISISHSSTFTNQNYHSQRFVPNSRTQSSLRGLISYTLAPVYGYLPTHGLVNPPPPVLKIKMGATALKATVNCTVIVTTNVFSCF